MSIILNAAYWSQRYQDHNTGWDVGQITRPLQAYIDQLADKNLRILIPGAGNGYEAEYLWQEGFEQVYVLDYAAEPLANLKSRCPSFPDTQLLHESFFDFTPAEAFDLILEQTFFCALPPERRTDYAKKMHSLLKSTGKLVGVLFQIPLNTDRPPFGGSASEYLPIFTPYFELSTFQTCHNSIAPRAGNELFFIAHPKR